MEVRRIELDKDFSVINGWLKSRHLPLWQERFMPRIGMMAYEEDLLMAAGFMRICEGNVGLFDSLVSNKDITGPFRDKAIDKVIEAVVEEGKIIGLVSIIGLTVIPSLMDRIIRKHGFFKSDSHVMVLNFEMKCAEGEV